jgi:uncharacterized protein YqgC (DUF456 family)
MELTDTGTAATLGGGVLIVLGIIVVIVPGMPGLVVAWAGVLVWAVLVDAGPARWTILALATFLGLLGMVTKYLLPGRSLRMTGVPTRSLLAGGVLAIVGFFVVPVVGLFLGFVAGVFLSEWLRLSRPGLAWPSTVSALKAVGVSIIVELFFAMTIAAVWVFGLVLLG